MPTIEEGALEHASTPGSGSSTPASTATFAHAHFHNSLVGRLLSEEPGQRRDSSAGWTSAGCSRRTSITLFSPTLTRSPTRDGKGDEYSEKAIAASSRSSSPLEFPIKDNVAELKSSSADPYLLLELEVQELPTSWSNQKKALHTFMVGLITFTTAFAAAIFSSGMTPFTAEMGISAEVGVLATSLFVLGLAFGPTVASALTETFGRKALLVYPSIISVCAAWVVANASNACTVFIARFVQGFTGSAPVSIGGAMLVDIYGTASTGWPLATFVMTTFAGPAIGPVFGSLLVRQWGWRATAWISVPMTGLAVLSLIIFMYETYTPLLLQQKAAELRRVTGEWRWHSVKDMKHFDVHEVLTVFVARPCLMLTSIKEIMLLLMSLHLAFAFGLLFLLLSTYPIAFHQERGWSSVTASLPFLAMLFGQCLGFVGHLAFVPRNRRKRDANSGRPVPEERLIPSFIGAVSFAAGLLVFSLTTLRGGVQSWVPSALSGILTGFGFMLLFISGSCWIIDCYASYAASALAAAACARGIMGAAMPLFAKPLNESLGIRLSTLILAGVAFLLAAIVPFFWIFGARLRRASQYAPSDA